jgi:extradiol dioxygenase family protein
VSHLPFHFAFPVKDLASTRAFYGKLLGCSEAEEQATMFLLDASGNALELKAFRNPDAVYAR